MRGVLTLRVETENPIYNNFLNFWRAGNLTIPISEQKNITSETNLCLLNELPVKIDQNFFNPITAESMKLNPDAVYAYDAYMALGIAACKKDKGVTLPIGMEYFNILVNSVDFEGLSGRVTFNANGDRDVSFLKYKLIQFMQRETNSWRLLKLGTYENATWSLTLANAVFRDGTNKLPAERTAPVQNFNFISQSLKNWGYAQSGILMMLSLGCLYAIFLLWENTVLIYSQRDIMIVYSVGILVVSFIPLLLTADDGPTKILNPSVSCQASIILAVAGFSICALALLVKNHRIYCLFFGKRLKRSRIRTLVAILYFCVLAELVIIIAWCVLDPLVYKRTVTEWRGIYPLSSYGGCVTGETGYWLMGKF